MRPITSTISPGLLSLLLFTCLAVLTACDDGYQRPTSDDPYADYRYLPAGKHTLDVLVDEFDRSDVFAVLELNQTTSEIFKLIDPANDTWQEFDLIEHIGRARTYRIEGSRPASVGELKVNNQVFSEIASGSYVAPGAEDEAEPELFFATANNQINIQGNSEFPQFSETASFAAAPRFTNIVRGQKISRASNFVFEWSGLNAGYADFELTVAESYAEPRQGPVYSVIRFIDNNGTQTLRPREIENLPNGRAEVLVRQFETIPLLLPNQERMYVVGISAHKLMIELVD